MSCIYRNPWLWIVCVCVCERTSAGAQKHSLTIQPFQFWSQKTAHPNSIFVAATDILYNQSGSNFLNKFFFHLCFIFHFFSCAHRNISAKAYCCSISLVFVITNQKTIWLCGEYVDDLLNIENCNKPWHRNTIVSNRNVKVKIFCGKILIFRRYRHPYFIIRRHRLRFSGNEYRKLYHRHNL